MCEAAAELFKATGDQQYLNDAKQWFSGGTAWGYSWDDKTVGCQVRNIFTLFLKREKATPNDQILLI